MSTIIIVIYLFVVTLKLFKRVHAKNDSLPHFHKTFDHITPLRGTLLRHRHIGAREGVDLSRLNFAKTISTVYQTKFRNRDYTFKIFF